MEVQQVEKTSGPWSEMARSRRNSFDTLAPELKHAIAQAGDSPVRLTDPETHRDDVLVSAEVYEQLMDREVRREQDAFLPNGQEECQGPADGG